MTFRQVRLFAVAGVLSLIFVAAVTVRPAGDALSAAAAVAPAAQSSGFVFWGCWTQFSSGTCRDIYRDAQGTYWICRACGTTTKPSSTTCSRISQRTLDSGFWCS